jgi:hypothetical protein
VFLSTSGSRVAVGVGVLVAVGVGVSAGVQVGVSVPIGSSQVRNCGLALTQPSWVVPTTCTRTQRLSALLACGCRRVSGGNTWTGGKLVPGPVRRFNAISAATSQRGTGGVQAVCLFSVRLNFPMLLLRSGRATMV